MLQQCSEFVAVDSVGVLGTRVARQVRNCEFKWFIQIVRILLMRAKVPPNI